MRYIISILAIILIFGIIAQATSVSVTIYGTNKSNADSNVTCYGCNNTIEVQAWNTSYVKNWTVALNNASDSISFNISNVTAYQVQELKVNGTAVNAYQAGANGMLNFTYTQTTGNRTYVLAPASKINGYNFTWGWFWNNAIFADNVGIGRTTAEDYPFDVLKSSTGDISRFMGSGGEGLVVNSGASSIELIGYDGSVLNNVSIRATSAANSQLYLKTDGNIGIGTTSPATELDVNGVISGNGSGLSSLNASNITIGTLMKTVTVNRSYVKDTVYQNTNSSAMFITTTAYASGAGTTGCNYKTGTTNPPTDLVGSQSEANADMQSFWVLPQHYFAAFQSAGTCTILSWSVWQ